ncbi:hypothetical protein, partial [Kocuria salsicia]|uniref:hypothetical protein n=1 Tax=Kocuria salsicia TaxID=664639 RepID=UPI001643C814
PSMFHPRSQDVDLGQLPITSITNPLHLPSSINPMSSIPTIFHITPFFPSPTSFTLPSNHT